jgi:hypothetical protein
MSERYYLREPAAGLRRPVCVCACKCLSVCAYVCACESVYVCVFVFVPPKGLGLWPNNIAPPPPPKPAVGKYTQLVVEIIA